MVKATNVVLNPSCSDASLEVVARRAWVGIGTHYRHFPTREALFESVYPREVRQLSDFAEQLKTLRRMGSLGDLLGMIPGLKKLAGAADSEEAKREMVRIQAIIDSMTRQERANHLVLNGRRRSRIATGSGTSVQDVNRFIKQFDQTRKMMKKLTRMGGSRPMMRVLGLG